MYDDNARNSQSFAFPFFLKSHSGEAPICISKEESTGISFLDNKLQSKEFQLQYNKLFTTITPFLPMSHNANGSNTDNKIKRAEDMLLSLENKEIATNEVYLKVSECLFDMIQLTNSLPNDKSDSVKALSYQVQLIDKMIDYVKPKLEPQ